MKILTGAVILVTAALATAEPASDAEKKEYERFKGTWKFESIISEGKKSSGEQFKDARLKLNGNQFSMTIGEVTFKGTFKVDVAKKPKTLDITFTEGPEKGKTTVGIYKLEGDTYTVCLNLKGKDRPTQFDSKEGSGHILEVLKRVSK